MFFETRKKFIKSFSEIKNKENLKCLSYRNVANMMFYFRGFLQIWIILIGFRDANNFVNIGICKCKTTRT